MPDRIAVKFKVPAPDTRSSGVPSTSLGLFVGVPFGLYK